MSATNYPPLSRVPGHVYNVKDHALDKDLTKLSKRELLDIKSRQEEVLKNKSRLEKLPDKGERVQLLYKRVVKALEMKNEIESATNFLESLNLGEKDIDNLEWKGSDNKKYDLDSDDDEDPIAILASNTKNKKILRRLSINDQIITEDDLKEAEEIVKGVLQLDPVLERIVTNENMDPSKRFLPHKPRFKSASWSEDSLSDDGFKKIRDNSAATPPVHVHGAKLLSLRESIEAEHTHHLKMKELQEKQAAERLAVKAKELVVSSQEEFPASSTQKTDSMSKYRITNPIFDDDNDSEEYSSEDDVNLDYE